MLWANLGEHADEKPPHIRLLGGPQKCPAFKLPSKLAIKLICKCCLTDSTESNNRHHLELLVTFIMHLDEPLFKLVHNGTNTNKSVAIPTWCVMGRGKVRTSTSSGRRTSNGVKVTHTVPLKYLLRTHAELSNLVGYP
jgi:hypothetical protein